MQVKVKKLHEAAVIPKLASAGAACFDLCAVVEPSQIMGNAPLAGFYLRMLADEAVTEAAKDSAALYPGDSISFRTGLSFEIPAGFAMLIYSRSGHGFKFATRLVNSTGLIDSDYRGEVMVKLTREPSASTAPSEPLFIKTGDRIAQAMIIPVLAIEFVLADDLTETARGAGGFGSTGA